jgi:hypothetical protein
MLSCLMKDLFLFTFIFKYDKNLFRKHNFFRTLKINKIILLQYYGF